MKILDADLVALMTPQERAEYESELLRENALASPADYAEIVSDGDFLRPRHIELLSQVLVDLIEDRLLKPHTCGATEASDACLSDGCVGGEPFQKLIVSMPPRHGKSELISKYAPAWYLTRHPEREVVVAGYASDFAAEWGRKARDVLVEAPAGLAPPLRSDSSAASKWLTKAGGGMFTAGVGGPLTGKGAHLLIIDDPVKNWEDAQSELLREKAWTWALSTAMSRVQPIRLKDGSWGRPGKVVLVMTRWHGDDLGGRFIANEGDEWYQLVLPAIAGPDDALGRPEGEALWPDRVPLSDLLKLKSSLGPQIWSALYQQSPFIEGGGLFEADKARFYRHHTSDKGSFVQYLAPEGTLDGSEGPPVAPWASIARFGIVDLAASTRTTADYSVFSLWGVADPGIDPSEGGADRKRLLLLDVFRARIEGADHMATLERLNAAWKPRFWGIEKATYGLTLIQTAARTGRIPVRELRPDTDKVSRAFAAGALMHAGRLWFPKDHPILDEWLAELVAFPNGAHDDMVDCTSYAALVLSDRLVAPRKPKKGEPQTIEQKIEARIDEKRKRRRFHPTLGTGF